MQQVRIQLEFPLTIWHSMTFEQHHVVCNRATSKNSLTFYQTYALMLPQCSHRRARSCLAVCMCGVCIWFRGWSSFLLNASGPFDCAFDMDTCNGQSNIKRKSLRLAISSLDFLYDAVASSSLAFATYVFRTCRTANVLHVVHLFLLLFCPKKNIYFIFDTYKIYDTYTVCMSIWICSTLTPYNIVSYGGWVLFGMQHRDTTSNTTELQCTAKNLSEEKNTVADRIYALHPKWISFW